MDRTFKTRNKSITFLICFVLSILATIFLPYTIKLSLDSTAFNNSIFSLVCVFLFFLLFYFTATRTGDKRLYIQSYIFGVLITAAMVVGRSITLDGAFNFDKEMPMKAVTVFVVAPVFAAIVALLLHYIPKAAAVVGGSKIENKLDGFFKGGKKEFLLTWLFIFLCWVPVLLALYPGILAYDTHRQIPQFFSGEYTTHHPVFSTLLIGGGFKAGLELFGSYNAGITFYGVAQMIAMSGIFAYVCGAVKKFGVPAVYRLGMILFLALFPINPVWGLNPTKDVLYTGFILLLLLTVLEIIYDRESFFSSWKKPLKFIIIAVLVGLNRNTGIYVIVLLALLLVICYRKHWKSMLAMCLVAVVACGLSISGINHAVNAKKGSTREMLSVPLQQIARVVYYNEDELSEAEMATIYELVAEERFEDYNPQVSDPIKNGFIDENFHAAPGKYIKLWMDLGKRYPGVYINAFLENSMGAWYPDWDYPSHHRYLQLKVRTDTKGVGDAVYRDSKFEGLLTVLEKIFHDAKFMDYPLISQMFSVPLQFWILLFCTFAAIYYRKKKLLLAMAIPLIIWLTVLVGPIILLRYTYPILLSDMVLIGVLLAKKGEFALKPAGLEN